MKHKVAAQQYLHLYSIDDKSEIGLREYDLSAKALEADQRSLTAAAGIALFFAGTATTLIGASFGNSSAHTQIKIVLASFGTSFELAFSLMVFAATALAIRYFALLQQSATYAARKIIVLRRLLGIDYGHIETVLPTNRLDGANEPFALPMFPGWHSLPALPVIALTALAGVAQASIYAVFRLVNPSPDVTMFGEKILATHSEVAVLTGLGTSLLLLWVYRWSLFEDFENMRLFVAVKFGLLMKCRLKHRLGYVIYRMRLSVFEAQRLGINLEYFYSTLVWMEDRAYFKHNGNSVRAAIAAVFRFVFYKKISGASTIYQQLVRSNFLERFDAPMRRKILEWILAPWLNAQFTKSEGLNLYLCSVRYAHDVIGIAAAIRHYFPNHPLGDPLNRSQAFFLIERLSNVTGTFPKSRIQRLVNQALISEIIFSDDVRILSDIYFKAGQDNLINLQGQVPELQS